MCLWVHRSTHVQKLVFRWQLRKVRKGHKKCCLNDGWDVFFVCGLVDTLDDLDVLLVRQVLVNFGHVASGRYKIGLALFHLF